MISISKDKELPNFISEIFKGFEDLNIWLYLHGSYSDNSICDFSDIDSIAILTQITNIKKYKKWERACYMKMLRFDPLQHHGIFSLNKSQLFNVDISEIHPIVIDKSIRLCGPRQVNYSINSDYKNKYRDKIYNSIRFLDYLFESQLINSPYYLKHFVGNVLLMPALLMQFNGKNVTKKYGIENSEIILKSSNELICNCSEIRSNWSVVTNHEIYRKLKSDSFFYENPDIFRIRMKRKIAKIKFEFNFEELKKKYDNFRREVFTIISG